MNNFRHIALDETESTNSYLMDLIDRGEKLEEFTVVSTSCQTKGRGQRGNSWESENNKNLIFSFVVYPSFLLANQQFVISKLISLSVFRVLASYSKEFRIKWPNDIYWNDKKVAGILIENVVVDGRLDKSVIGVGINVNQKSFVSDAPNPVSLINIFGREFSIGELMKDIMSEFMNMYDSVRNGAIEKFDDEYINSQYRLGKASKFRDLDGEFIAHINDVNNYGQIMLMTEEGIIKTYGFKEIQYIL